MRRRTQLRSSAIRVFVVCANTWTGSARVYPCTYSHYRGVHCSHACRIGTVEAAAHAVCFQVWLASSLLVDALALAAQSLIGQTLQQRPRRALRFARRALTLGTVLGVALAAVLLCLREGVAAAFTSDPATQAAVAHMLWWVALLQPVTALAFAWDGIMYGVSGFRCGLSIPSRQ